MADKKDKKNKKESKLDKKTGKKISKKGGFGWKARLFLVAFVLLALVFLPTAILLFFGMLPSMVAFFVNSRGVGARASTISAMNLAGCIPFIFKLWASGNDFEASIDILSSGQALIIMYTAAAFGYMIDWVVTGIVSSYLYQKGMGRMKAIRKRQAVLVELWGERVSGKAEGK